MTTITQDTLDELVIIQRSGLSNMFDLPTVRQLANELDLHRIGGWIDEHPPGDYAHLIMGQVSIAPV